MTDEPKYKSTIHTYNEERENSLAEDGSTADGRPDFALPGPGDPAKQNEPGLAARIFEWVKVIVVAVVLGLLITTFVIQRNTVFGDSMYPTLKAKDELVVEKVSKWFGGVERGDIITVHMDADYGGEANIIKRVIGLPGDHIELKDGAVYRNGEKLDEPYVAEGKTTRILDRRFSDVILGEDEYFLLGDNRTVSLDSRRFGPVKKHNIIGEVLIRVWPFDRFGSP